MNPDDTVLLAPTARSRIDRDADGFADIGAYGVVSDGRSVALVAADGSVDWWALPRLDSTPPFAALLDPAHGGRVVLRPADPAASAVQRYVPDTNLLETTWTTAVGRVVVTDCLNSGNAGHLPWTELARRVDGISGSVMMTSVVEPGSGLGSWQPWAEDDPRGTLLHTDELVMAVRHSAGVAVDVGRTTVSGAFTVSAGERVVIAAVASDAAPLFLTDVDAVDARLDRTATNWRLWPTQVQWSGPRREQVVRSALALKTLMMADTGAIAAAATTSLPERVGGPKNWDYRLAWIRDTALTVDALSECGLQEEVHAAITWLLRTIRDDGPDIHVVYDLDGVVPAGSRTAAVPGYRDSRPVRLGNDATSQVQLGVYGDLFGTVATWVFGGHVLDVRSARQLADLADRCADVWRHDDAGIWELQDDRPYTSSKMNVWRALDAAARLADAGHLAGPERRWRGEAEAVRAWIGEHCWSTTKQAYTFYAGTEDLDASVLLGAHSGFDRGPRMNSTLDAVHDELGVGPLLYRYTGVASEEQTFLACAYWSVHALAVLGRTDEVEAQMRKLDLVASPLGLLSEMVTPGTRELVGNIPQALSHLALINAAAALQHATTSERNPS